MAKMKLSFTQLVMAILPITASMHLLKAILKTSSRIPYWDFVFSDPKGVDSAQAIIDNPDLLDKSLLLGISPIISVLAILLPVAAFVLSMFIIRKQVFNSNLSKIVSIVAVLVYASLFIVSLIAWRFF